jgi:hypothetical protein
MRCPSEQARREDPRHSLGHLAMETELDHYPESPGSGSGRETRTVSACVLPDGVIPPLLTRVRSRDYAAAMSRCFGDSVDRSQTEHGRLVTLDDAEKGLKDALAGKTNSEENFRKSLRPSAPRKMK